MPSYAAAQDIIDRYGDDLLCSLAPDLEGEGYAAEIVAQALADASGEIDLSLRGRYRLPLATVPGVLVRACVDLALSMIPRNAAEDGDLIQARAKLAREMLRGLARGEQTLELEAAISQGGGDILYDNPPSPFDKGLEGF